MAGSKIAAVEIRVGSPIVTNLGGNLVLNPNLVASDVHAISVADLIGPGLTVALVDQHTHQKTSVRLDLFWENKKNNKTVARAAQALSGKKKISVFWC